MALKSIQKAADSWGVSVYTVRRLAAAGLVHTVTVGRRRLISESEITRIVETGVSNAARRKTLHRSTREKGQRK